MSSCHRTVVRKKEVAIILCPSAQSRCDLRVPMSRCRVGGDEQLWHSRLINRISARTGLRDAPSSKVERAMLALERT
jgi:hypothetical protein